MPSTLETLTRFVAATGPNFTRALIASLRGESIPAPEAPTPEAPTPEAPTPEAPTLITVGIPFGPWVRYHRSDPWAATIADWPSGANPSYSFINDAWRGTHGNGGTLTIDLLPGTVIRVGQKVYKGDKASGRLEWRMVLEDGNTRKVEAAQARELWLKSRTA